MKFTPSCKMNEIPEVQYALSRLGNSDPSVFRICLGCMVFGGAGNGQHTWTIDEEHSREIIKRA